MANAKSFLPFLGVWYNASMDHPAANSSATTVSLLAYGEEHGFTRGLCYRIARAMRGHHYLVCVHCGWAWAGLNRCLNPECKGFCSWGEVKGETPTSWTPHPEGGLVPRMPGQASAADRAPAIERLAGVLRSADST